METLDLTPLIKRNMVWDTLPCTMAPDFMPKVGLLPGSAGGDAVEHSSSHRRLAQLEPISDTLTVLSRSAGQAIGTAILESQDHSVVEDDPELAHYLSVAEAAVRAVVANLLDSGTVHLNERFFQGE